METRKKLAGVVFLAGMLAVSLVIYAGGELEPSAPPGPIMKTLDEVEPRIPVQSLSGSVSAVYVIDQPGSYYFTGDIVIDVNDKDGIIVEVNDVTIDLMGYTLKGPGSGNGRGIYMDGRSNVEVRNGTVRNFAHGIVENANGKGHRVINVRAVSNINWGIYINAKGNLVKDCTAVDNGSSGIVASYGSTLTGNTAYNNGDHGIYANTGSTITGNTASNNGADGISADTGCTVTGNTASSNEYYGISLSGNNLVDQNTAYLNNRSGGSYTNIEACGSCTFGLNNAP